MNLLDHLPAVADHLARLSRRIRWKRWLHKLQRFTCLLAIAFLLLYFADTLLDLGTHRLRVAFAILFFGVSAIFTLDLVTSWFSRLDPVGLAQTLEQRNPELAERLVTLVQIQNDQSRLADPHLAHFLGIETEKQLASISPESACPLNRERTILAGIAIFLAVLFGGLTYVPTFDRFAERFFTAWETSLVPFDIDLIHSESASGTPFHVHDDDDGLFKLVKLDRHCYSFGARCRLLDKFANRPSECWLVCENAVGNQARIPMKPFTPGYFVHEIENPADPLRCWVQAGEIVSKSVAVIPIIRPAYKGTPTMFVTAPKYLGQVAPVAFMLEHADDRKVDILRFSKLKFKFALDREPLSAWLRVKRQPAAKQEIAEESAHAVGIPLEDGQGMVEVIAAKPGSYEAELILKIERGLGVILPLGQWTVHDDHEPRFTLPLRFVGSNASLAANKEYQISPDDALKLQTAVEDEEGLNSIEVEYRVNEVPARIEAWIQAVGKKQLTINDWLPLPTKLKDGDRVQFRVRASDNRRLKKGEIAQTKTVILPSEDVLPHVVTVPETVGGEDRWITLRVDRTVGDFLKEQVKTQRDEVQDVVNKIKQKLVNESQQLEKLLRTVHQQSALTQEQKQQVEKIRTLNRDITEELMKAGRRFAENPGLARLAEHFLDIAEYEMLKSAEALNRFSEKDRPIVEGEKDLQASQAALLQAQNKLERIGGLNKMVAQDRLDQWQFEKLANRQEALAARLEKLLADPPLSDAELAREIDAIRQEQAKLAEQRTQLESQNQLVQESLAALQQKNVQRLAQLAKQVEAEQRKMRELSSDKKSAKEEKALQDKLDKLAADLAELAQKGIGIEAKAMAKDAAQAVDQAKKAMEAGQAMKAKGDTDLAKAMDAEAAKQLEIVVKQLAKLAQDQAMKGPAKDNAEKMAQALKESGEQMKVAEDKLPAMPKDAEAAMKSAAQKLTQAADQAQRQAARRFPKAARNPTALNLSGGEAGSPLLDANLGAFQGKAWGELPGELKTRMMQDFRVRFGEEYAEMIQRYFERLANSGERTTGSTGERRRE